MVNTIGSFSSSFLESLLRNSDEGVIYVTALKDEQGQTEDFEFQIVNLAAQKILGKSESDLLGKSMKTLYSPQRKSSLFSDYLELLKTGSHLRKEVLFEGHDQPRWIRVNAVQHENGILINLIDITELKDALSESHRTRHLYSTLVDHLPGVEVLLIEKSLDISIFRGFPFKQIDEDIKLEEGANLMQIFNAAQQSAVLPPVRKAMKGEGQRLEVEKEDRLYRVNFIPFQDIGSNVSHVLVISEDISIFRMTQNDLRNKIYALESANESLEQFAYVASHDLQEPLRKIRAFGDRLSTKYASQLEGSGQDYIERMQNAAARMQTLISDLLKYSRIGRIIEEPQKVELGDVVDDILNDMESTLSETGGVVKVDELPALWGETSQFRQLFQNLISNGIKFKRDDVQPAIHIRCSLVPAAEVTKYEGLKESSEYYHLEVEDNGIGFDEKYLDRIFNIFQRLHGRSEYKGTGIGLAICRKIVENHGGYIGAHSQPGQGAVFYIILPKDTIL